MLCVQFLFWYITHNWNYRILATSTRTIVKSRLKVSKNMLSGYCKKITEKYNISIGLVSKLIPTLRDKKEYVLHYRNLQLYLDLGLEIKKIHRVLNSINHLGLSNILTSTLKNESMPKIHSKRTSSN